MNGFLYRITITNPTGSEWADPFEYSGDGDSFGQAVADLIDRVKRDTGGDAPELVADLIDTALDAWIGQLTGGFPLRAERREFSDVEADFDLTITQPEGRES